MSYWVAFSLFFLSFGDNVLCIFSLVCRCVAPTPCVASVSCSSYELVNCYWKKNNNNSDNNSAMPFWLWSQTRNSLHIFSLETGDHLNHFPRRQWIRFCDHILGPVVTRLPDKPRAWRWMARREPGICNRWASNQCCSDQSETRTCYHR